MVDDIFDLDKRWLLLGGIGSYVAAWIFYFSPIENTSLGILFHYVALVLIGFGLLEDSKKNKITILIIIYFISLILDYPFYEIRHGLVLGLFYYISVNLIHISLLLSVLVIDKKSHQLTMIGFILFTICFSIWLLMPYMHVLIMAIILFLIACPGVTIICVFYLFDKKFE